MSTRSAFGPRLILPAFAYDTGKRGADRNILTDTIARGLTGLVGVPAGGAQGFNTEGDVIQETVDGVSLNGIWREFQQTLALQNADRNRLINFLSYGVTNPIETVPQFGSGAEFEVASEFGVPVGQRTEATYFQLGFPFEWYDTGARYTWKYLAEATAEQVESVHQAILEADNRLMFGEVMRTLFRNTNRTATINGNAYSVYTFYNNDGTVPPPYKSNTFTGTHSHFLTSGAATLTTNGTDIDDMEDALTEHGYSRERGVQLVLMVNKQEADIIRNYRSIANGGTALYDFIPSSNTPAFLLPTDLRPAPNQPQPPPSIRGMKVIGSYGEFIVVEEGFIPAGYMVAFGTGGQDSLTNPIGIREHANTALRGLRLVKGRSADYPLQDSYYQRGFGCGVRQRGAAVIMQVTASATYTVPPTYA